MQQSAIVLANNVSGVSQVAVTVQTGGRYVLALSATTYDGTTCFLQTQLQNGSWLSLNGTTYSVNTLTAGFDLPAGQYRMNLGASTAALYATLIRIPY